MGGVGLVAKLRAVLRVKDFRKLWLSMSLSSFGDWLGLLAITATATSLVDGFAAANFALGGVLLFRLLPAIVLGPLAGAFADRFDRRKTMVVTDIMRFVLFASIPLVDNLIWLFVAQFLIEAISLFWIPAKEAAVPNMLRKDQLEPANQLSLVTTYGLTPVLAAVVFAVLTTMGGDLMRLVPGLDEVDLALFLNALTFLVAAIVIWNLPSISGKRAAGAAKPQESFFGSLKEGFSFAGHTPLVRGLVVGITGAFAAAGVIIATGQAYATALGGGEAAYGLLFGAVFIGLGLGIAIGPSVARDLARERIFGVAIVGAGAMVLLMAWTFTLWIALLLVVFMGFFAGIAYLAGFTLLGTEVEDEIRGRTFAIVQSLVRAALILSLAVVPFGVGLLGQHELDLGAFTVPVTGERIMLLRRRADGHRGRRPGLPADGRRPAGPADRRRRHRAPPRHHRPAPAGRRRGPDRLRGRRGRRQVHPGAPAAGVADERGPRRPGPPSSPAPRSPARASARSCSTARTPRSPRARRRCCTPPTGPSTSTTSCAPRSTPARS